MSYKIYHNPRCRKSRETLAILQEKGVEPEIRLYLEDVPTAAELKKLGSLLGKSPMEWIRKGEQEFKDHVKGKDLSDEQLYALMAKYPKLIERAIVVKDGKKAVLCRPPEEVLKVL